MKKKKTTKNNSNFPPFIQSCLLKTIVKSTKTLLFLFVYIEFFEHALFMNEKSAKKPGILEKCL